MRKTLFSALLVLFCSQIFGQSKHAGKKIESSTTNNILGSSYKLGSVLKLNIFSPLLGYSQFSFEKSIAGFRSVEFGLGIIGAGRNLNIQRHIFSLGLDRFPGNYYRPGHKNQFGGFFEFGYKFMKPFKSHTKSQINVNLMNPMEGLYLKPSFIFGAYGFNQFRDDSTTVTVRRHHRFGALMMNLGYQWFFDKKIGFELYCGMGGEIDNVKDEDDLYGHPFVLVIAKDNPGVNFAFAAGFRFCFLLK